MGTTDGWSGRRSSSPNRQSFQRSRFERSTGEGAPFSASASTAGTHRSRANRAASLLTAAGSIAATVVFPLLPFTPKMRTGYNVPISHVPGPRAEMYWNGARVEEIIPVSTVYDGMALNVTTCSYADRVGFGYAAGADVVPDIDKLIPLTEECLTELESAVGASCEARRSPGP
jgi:WS/DGAT C-terminal domain